MPNFGCEVFDALRSLQPEAVRHGEQIGQMIDGQLNGHPEQAVVRDGLAEPLRPCLSTSCEGIAVLGEGSREGPLSRPGQPVFPIASEVPDAEQLPRSAPETELLIDGEEDVGVHRDWFRTLDEDGERHGHRSDGRECASDEGIRVILRIGFCPFYAAGLVRRAQTGGEFSPPWSLSIVFSA